MDIYAYDYQNTDDYNGYVMSTTGDVRWSLSAEQDAYQLQQTNNAASVLCKKAGISGVLTASVVVEKVVGGVLTGERAAVTQQVRLKGAEKQLIAGELF